MELATWAGPVPGASVASPVALNSLLRGAAGPALEASADFAEGTPSTSWPLIAAASAAALAGASSRGRRRRQAVRKAAPVAQAVPATPAVPAAPAISANGVPGPYETMCLPVDAPESVRRRFEAIAAEAQERICAAMEAVDGKAKFSYERSGRPGGGGGIARVMKDGNVFEKAGVNLSVVYGEMSQAALGAATEGVGSQLKPGEKVPFFACGISSVMHPKNPFCPTMHFNYRYFETQNGVWWFGGGTDITPSYLDEGDMRHFHGTYKEVLDRYDDTWYPKFKDWADKYFVIGHRGETRGLGGIFFDDFNSQTPERHLSFSKDCLSVLEDAYAPILQRNRDRPFTTAQKEWQQLRRGRYVEFNLVYDRGTIFGLKMLPSGTGKIESILMSLPETARWEYCQEPEEGTPEYEIMQCFKTPRDWL